MTGPIEAVVVDGVAVPKASLRSFIDAGMVHRFADADALRAADLADVSAAFVAPHIYVKDAADTTTADDGVACIIDSGGLRFKAQALEAIWRQVGDETTTITAGTAKLTFRMPFGFRALDVRASLATASSSGAVTVDINEGGSSILSTEITIDQDEKTSVTAATPAVISDPVLADDAEMTVDIDDAGTGAKGLKVALLGYRIAS